MKVFVYGSLKKNFGNHVLLQNSKYLGEGVTLKPQYSMVNLGSFPGVYINGSGYIRGEAYEIDQPTLVRLDILEGEGNFYSRRKVDIKVGDDIHECYMYVLLRNYAYPDTEHKQILNKNECVYLWKKDYQILIENTL